MNCLGNVAKPFLLIQKSQGLPISPYHGTQQTPLNGREIEILLVLEPQNNKLFNGCLVKKPSFSRKGLVQTIQLIPNHLKVDVSGNRR